MGAEQRPGRCRQEWREAAQFCPTEGERKHLRRGERTVWKASPHTILSITCNAPELQVSLEKNLQTSHMDNTIWRCSKTSYVFTIGSSPACLSERGKGINVHKPSRLPSNCTFIQWLSWLTHSIFLYRLNHHNLKPPFTASICLERKNTELH